MAALSGSIRLTTEVNLKITEIASVWQQVPLCSVAYYELYECY